MTNDDPLLIPTWPTFCLECRSPSPLPMRSSSIPSLTSSSSHCPAYCTRVLTTLYGSLTWCRSWNDVVILRQAVGCCQNFYEQWKMCHTYLKFIVLTYLQCALKRFLRGMLPDQQALMALRVKWGWQISQFETLCGTSNQSNILEIMRKYCIVVSGPFLYPLWEFFFPILVPIPLFMGRICLKWGNFFITSKTSKYFCRNSLE